MTLVALVYAHDRSADYAGAIVNVLNAAFSPSHTDLMLSPEEIDEWLEKNDSLASNSTANVKLDLILERLK